MSKTGFYGSGSAGIFGRLLLEAIGAGLLVVIGTKVATDAIVGQSIAGSPFGSTAVALSFGGALAVLVYALGPRSGCHLNPAVTLGAMIVRAIGVIQGLQYMVAQVCGAYAASYLLMKYMPAAATAKAKLGLTALAPGYNVGSLLFFEGVGTLVLVLAVLFAAVSGRVPQAASGIAVGGALFLGVMFAGSVTGGGINPARVLGPMLVLHQFAHVGFYLLAEFMGAAVAAVLYLTLGGVKEPGS